MTDDIANNMTNHIIHWLKNYLKTSNMKGFVIGVSGGIDSALTSTLCAKTGYPVLCLNMPIRQHNDEYERAIEHIDYLKQYDNVSDHEIPLNLPFDAFAEILPKTVQEPLNMANIRSRLRMTCLYSFAGKYKYLVVGTGNKVEDFGVGFFTKYGDGGVDISPIADMLKTEVFYVAKHLGIHKSILHAEPTDGLWDEKTTDYMRIGATYPELEWAMSVRQHKEDKKNYTQRQKEVLDIYQSLHKENKHKMQEIPVCILDNCRK